MRRGLVVAALVFGLCATARAEDVLGIPCTTQANGTRACLGDIAHRVPSWDGLPLDVDLWLPAKTGAPVPLVVFLHGFSGSKDDVTPDITALAADGYAVMSYSARGFGDSCGSPASRAAAPTACARGWSHLADVRYEPRDTQTLAGKLADAGIVDGQRVGVTGTSYGAGQSLMLATLKDRTVLPDYSVVPWTSPGGKPMAIAAAAPNWAWSNLASMLVPNGRALDYSTDNDYGNVIGMPKVSYVGLLTGAGNGRGYFAPMGAEFEADANGWVSNFLAGEPWGDYHRRVIAEITAHHSPYTIEDLPGAGRHQPAPIFDNTAWTDDLLPPTEQLVYRNRVLARYPRAEYDLLLSDGAGHPRAALAGKQTKDLPALQKAFFDRLLKGAGGTPLGIRTYTQGCGASEVAGPFDTRTWAAQHPGEVRASFGEPQSFTQASDPATAALVDPLAAVGQAGCVTAPAADSPLAATYRMPAATGQGYTIMGSPTVAATLAAGDPQTQVDARLWDVAPDGSQAFVTRVAYRPRLDDAGTQVFQLHPNGWQVKPGHVVKLELVGSDSPYVRSANGSFSVTVARLELRLPVRETPGSGQVLAPRPLQARDGTALAPGATATEGVDAPVVRRRCRTGKRAVLHVRRGARVRAAGRRLRVRAHRVVVRRRLGRRVVVRIRIHGHVRRRVVRFCR